MRRRSANTYKARKSFAKNADKTHARNMKAAPMRGGFRI